MRCAISESLDQYLRDIDQEEPEAPAQAHCECGRFLPKYSTMPVCKACRDAYMVRLNASIDRAIAKEKAFGEAVQALAVDLKEARGA